MPLWGKSRHLSQRIQVEGLLYRKYIINTRAVLIVTKEIKQEMEEFYVRPIKVSYWQKSQRNAAI